MRNNYYDSGWKWPQNGEEAKEGPLPPIQAPSYGDVYAPAHGTELPAASPAEPVAQPTASQPVAAQVERVIITRQEQLAITPQIRERKPRRPKTRRTGLPGFLVCLLLIALLTAVVVYVQGGVNLRLPTGGLGDLWQVWNDWNSHGSDLPDLPDIPGWEDQDGWNKFYDFREEDWTKSLKSTSIKKAPVGDGTELVLTRETGETLSVSSIYEKVNPTVVAVQVEQDFGYSLGSGVIMSANGYIITNAHVIAGGKRAEVLLSDGSSYVAMLVGYDKSYDLAVLKVTVPGKDLPVAEFGDSDNLRVGDPAWAIGNPLGMELRGTMTDGMVSAINRQVGADNGTMTLIQTTAALNSGNSGGALINAAGQVVGITNMKMMSEDETIEGLGFAIPSRSVKEVADQIIAQGYYDDGVPLLGITVYTQTSGGDMPAGAYVSSVEPDSDAYKKGVRPGDIVIRANGAVVTSTEELLAAKAGLKAGDTLTLVLWREREERTVEITLMTRHQMDEAN